MKKSLRIVAALLALCFVLGVAPVDLLENTAPLMETAEAATKPTLSATSKSLLIGKSFTLSVKNAGGKTITWSTSSKAIATVTTKGVVKAVKPGTATITAKVGTTKLTCKVTVKTPTISMTSTKLVKGQSFTLKVSNAGTAKVTWSTSSKAIATVTSKGVVKGVKTGTATITAKVAGKSLKCKVTVIASGSISGTTGKTMTAGKKQTLSVVGFPGKTVTWKSSNTAVATITTKGVVTAKKAGTVTITATVASKKLTYKITVKAATTPKPTATPGPGMVVQNEYVTVSIPYNTNYDCDPNHTGADQVTRAGVNGVGVQTWGVEYQDGVEVKRWFIRYDIQKQPVTKIVKTVSSPIEDFTFESRRADDGTCTVTSYNGSATRIAIPSKNSEGKKVTEIGSEVFKDKTDLTSVKIPNSVKTINYCAFYNCSNLVGTLRIPDSVTSIGSAAFYKCSGLTGNLVIPNSVTNIGSSAFNGCSGFTGSLTLSNSLTTLTNSIFSGCSGFSGLLVIPESVTKIDSNAFNNCSGFTGSLTIPDSVTSIGGSAFSRCTGLTGDLFIPDSVTSIGAYAFFCCRFTGSLIIGNSVTSIGDYAFYDCDQFSGELTIGYSVKTIGKSAFNLCTKFTGNLMIPNSVISIGENAFSHCSKLTGTLTIGNSVVSIGDSAFERCCFTGDLSIPDSVTSIGNKAFYICHGFTGNLTIGNGVTIIGEEAFYECYYFSGSLTLGNSLTSIGENAFNECRGFSGSLIIPDSVSSIGNSAFYECSGFNGSLTIGNNVTSIGENAFCGCRGFTGDLIIPDSVTSMGNSAFDGCSGFNGNLTISNNVTELGEHIFMSCRRFTGSLIIPNSVNSISRGAFANCSGFSGSLIIPSSVNIISNSAFANCSGFIGDLIIPDSVTIIEHSAFYNCSGFTGSLKIGNNVTSIGGSAFWACSGFTGSLIIGNSVTEIDSCAFYECSGFTGSLIIPKSVTTINKKAFYGCNALTDIYLPDSIESIGTFSFTNPLTLQHIYAVPDSYAWNWCVENGFQAKLVEWNGGAYNAKPSLINVLSTNWGGYGDGVFGDAYSAWTEGAMPTILYIADVGGDVNIVQIIADMIDQCWNAAEDIYSAIQYLNSFGIEVDESAIQTLFSQLRTKVAQNSFNIFSGLTTSDLQLLVDILEDSEETSIQSISGLLNSWEERVSMCDLLYSQWNVNKDNYQTAYSVYTEMNNYLRIDNSSLLPSIEEYLQTQFPNINLESFGDNIELIAYFMKAVKDTANSLRYIESIQAFSEEECRQLEIAKNGTQNQRLKVALSLLIEQIQGNTLDVISSGADTAFEFTLDVMYGLIPEISIAKFFLTIIPALFLLDAQAKFDAVHEFIAMYELTLGVKNEALSQLESMQDYPDFNMIQPLRIYFNTYAKYMTKLSAKYDKLISFNNDGNNQPLNISMDNFKTQIEIIYRLCENAQE